MEGESTDRLIGGLGIFRSRCLSHGAHRLAAPHLMAWVKPLASSWSAGILKGVVLEHLDARARSRKGGCEVGWAWDVLASGDRDQITS